MEETQKRKLRGSLDLARRPALANDKWYPNAEVPLTWGCFNHDVSVNKETKPELPDNSNTSHGYDGPRPRRHLSDDTNRVRSRGGRLQPSWLANSSPSCSSPTRHQPVLRQSRAQHTIHLGIGSPFSRWRPNKRGPGLSIFHGKGLHPGPLAEIGRLEVPESPPKRRKPDTTLLRGLKKWMGLNKEAEQQGTRFPDQFRLTKADPGQSNRQA